MGFIEKNYFINDFARKTIMSYYNQNVLKLITEFSKIDSIMDYKMFCGLINKTGVLSKHRKTILSLKRVYGESLLYGHLSSIEHFAEIKKRDLKYFPIMEHGVTFWEIVNASGFPRVCQGDYLRENWKRKYPGVPLFCVGPYIHYADYYYSLEKRTALKKELGKTLLIVPAHTHEMASQDYDMQGFVDSIMRAKSSYQTVMVLAYWADLKYPLYDCFINAGAKVVSAGFRGDPYFISRLKTILSLADIVVGNDIGTFIGYAHYLKKPVRLLPNTIEYTATVSKVEEDLDGFKVYMKGYNSYILVEPDQLVSSDLSDLLLNISENDDIVFRVISESIIDSPYMDYFSVVALETTETEFITLESSTVILQKEILNAKIIGISVAILAFVGAVIVLGLAVKGKRKSKNG